MSHNYLRPLFCPLFSLPLFARFQKPLALVAGMVDTAQVDEVLLVCRRD